MLSNAMLMHNFCLLGYILSIVLITLKLSNRYFNIYYIFIISSINILIYTYKKRKNYISILYKFLFNLYLSNNFDFYKLTFLDIIS